MKYITLQRATDFCSYSQEYLSLRARKGKLKALKIGRNWYTTSEWLEDYIAKTNEYRTLLKRKDQGPEVDPPSNLPIYAYDADMWEDPPAGGEEVARQTAFLRKIQFALAFAMVIALIGVSFFHGFHQMLRAKEEWNPVVFSSAVALQQEVWEAGFSTGVFGMDFGGVLTEYVEWLRGL